MNYSDFLQSKADYGADSGFAPLWMPDFLFDFQKALVEWSLRKGRSAIFADCGLGKTPMELVWSQNVVQKTNKPVLILTPLAVAPQTVREGEKFGIETHQSRDGKWPDSTKIVVTNYQQLHKFSSQDFAGAVCDESGILKSFDGELRTQIVEFMRRVEYRMLSTATPAPNDYMELGNSSEALGSLRRVEMLTQYFKHDGGSTQSWRIKRHAQHDYWRWVCSWARACRKPSDICGEDGSFVLPPIKYEQHVVVPKSKRTDYLFDMPAVTLEEQRDERRRTVNERCEKVADLVNGNSSAICWCHLNEEGKMLASLIPDAVEVSGSDDDDVKEQRLFDFSCGKIRVLVTKPTIAGWGMNFQVCSHQTFFPSHSFEQWYQAVRRSWRFGQKSPVRVDIVTSPGESAVIDNLTGKAKAADAMFDNMVKFMNEELRPKKTNHTLKLEEIPQWLS